MALRDEEALHARDAAEGVAGTAFALIKDGAHRTTGAPVDAALLGSRPLFIIIGLAGLRGLLGPLLGECHLGDLFGGTFAGDLGLAVALRLGEEAGGLGLGQAAVHHGDLILGIGRELVVVHPEAGARIVVSPNFNVGSLPSRKARLFIGC
jgi:hypothetical protein